MKLENLKTLLGDKYKFTADYDLDTVRKAISENNGDFYGKVPFVLEAGCVDIEVEILGEEGEPLYGDYNICVKIDDMDYDSWRTFDTLPEIVDFNVPDIESEMFRLLDEYATENGLSYTEHNGQKFSEKMSEFETSQEQTPDSISEANDQSQGMSM